MNVLVYNDGNARDVLEIRFSSTSVLYVLENGDTIEEPLIRVSKVIRNKSLKDLQKEEKENQEVEKDDEENENPNSQS